MVHEPMFYVRFYVKVTTPEGRLIERFLEEERRLTREEVEKRRFQWQHANHGMQIATRIRHDLDLDDFV